MTNNTRDFNCNHFLHVYYLPSLRALTVSDCKFFKHTKGTFNIFLLLFLIIRDTNYVYIIDVTISFKLTVFILYTASYVMRIV